MLPDKHLELLIGLRTDITEEELVFPDWKGMKFELIELEIPIKGSKHLSLRLENREYMDIFASLCADLADNLSGATRRHERGCPSCFLDRWTRFFERYGLHGLLPEKRQGLFGELYWLRVLLENDIGCMKVLSSWRVARGYHDFEINGHVVEVKTTMSKEPRKVRISNERQLDDRGLISLHLLVLSIIRSDAGGESLPEIIETLKAIVSEAPVRWEKARAISQRSWLSGYSCSSIYRHLHGQERGTFLCQGRFSQNYRIARRTWQYQLFTGCCSSK